MVNHKYIASLLHANLEFVEKFGLCGLDPQMYYRLPFNKISQKYENKLTSLLHKAEKYSLSKLPLLLMIFIHSNKENEKLNVYGLSLYIQALLNMNSCDSSFLFRAKTIEKILLRNLITLDGGNYGVGNPGEVKNIYLPGSAEAIFAYLKLYEASIESYYIEIAEKIIYGVLENLKMHSNNFGIHFSYGTPGPDQLILNANALFFNALVAYDKLKPSSEIRELIEKAYKSLICGLRFREIPYGLSGVDLNKPIGGYDVYHTGFYLRSMWGITEYLGEANILTKIRASFDNQMKDFLSSDNFIIKLPSRKNQIDIHGVAEYIRSYQYVEKASHHDEVLIKNILYMSNGQGTYYYQRGLFELDYYMPRWGHFPMMLALSEMMN